jgi:hypothetical protein
MLAMELGGMEVLIRQDSRFDIYYLIVTTIKKLRR